MNKQQSVISKIKRIDYLVFFISLVLLSISILSPSSLLAYIYSFFMGYSIFKISIYTIKNVQANGLRVVILWILLGILILPELILYGHRLIIGILNIAGICIAWMVSEFWR